MAPSEAQNLAPPQAQFKTQEHADPERVSFSLLKELCLFVKGQGALMCDALSLFVASWPYTDLNVGWILDKAPKLVLSGPIDGREMIPRVASCIE